MRILTYSLLVTGLLVLAGCSSDSATTKTEQVRVVPAGEKAGVGHLTYNIVDSQVLTQLGEGDSPRIPHDRFMIIQVAVTNSSNVENPIPAIELVSDSGTTYNELTDGTGINNWLGIVRKVGPGQTERGSVAFDAPAAHYRLRFSDESANNEVLADLPLSYAHEKSSDALVPATDFPDLTGASGAQKPAK